MFLTISLASCRPVQYETKCFSVDNYHDYLENYKLNEEYNDIKACGKIESTNDAVDKAKDVMKAVYGEFALGTKGPYNVYYDSTADVWLVTGSMLFLQNSGAHVILKGEDGAVLAVWNYKF